MLEGLVADVLTRLLRQYVRGIDRDGLRVGLWKGELELRDVDLEPEALAVLLEAASVNVPVEVRAGRVRLLRIVVPWKFLLKQAVSFEMVGVTVVAGPSLEAGKENGNREERELTLKRGILSTDEAIRAAKWSASGEAGAERKKAGLGPYGPISGGTATSSTTPSQSNLPGILNAAWINRIVHNVRVEVRDVVIRFTHSLQDDSGVTTIGGGTLNSDASGLLVTVRADRVHLSNANPPTAGKHLDPTIAAPETSSLFDGVPAVVHKVISAEGVAIGWEAMDKREFESAATLADREQPIARYILEPLSASLYIALSQKRELSTPKARLRLAFNSIHMTLDEFQYKTILQVALWLVYYHKKVLETKSPRDRWQWAIDCLLPGFSARLRARKRFNKEGIRAARTAYVEYVRLRKGVLLAHILNQEDAPKQSSMKRLENMEDLLPLEDIINYRNVIDEQLQAELRARREEQQEERGRTHLWNFFARMRMSERRVNTNTNNSYNINDSDDNRSPSVAEHGKEGRNAQPLLSADAKTGQIAIDRDQTRGRTPAVPTGRIGDEDGGGPLEMSTLASSWQRRSASIQIPTMHGKNDEHESGGFSLPSRLVTGEGRSTAPMLSTGSYKEDVKTGDRHLQIETDEQHQAPSPSPSVNDRSGISSSETDDTPVIRSAETNSIGLRMSFHLIHATVSLSLGGLNGETIVPLSELSFHNLKMSLETRPHLNGLRFDAVLGSLQLQDLRSKTPVIYARPTVVRTNPNACSGTGGKTMPSRRASSRSLNEVTASHTATPNSGSAPPFRASEQPAGDGQDEEGDSYLFDPARSPNTDDGATPMGETMPPGEEEAMGEEQDEAFHNDDESIDSQTIAETIQMLKYGCTDPHDLRISRTPSVSGSAMSSFQSSVVDWCGPMPPLGTGTPASLTPAVCRPRYIAAIRFGEPSADGASFPQRERVLEATIGGLEAIADGPDGCLVSSVRFWIPPMDITPIVRFLSRATVARLDLLRKISNRDQGQLVDHKVPLRMDVVVRVPRIIFPTAGDTAPVLVADLGTLHLQTDPREETGVYSFVKVRLANLQALCLPSMGRTKHAQRILEPLSMDMNFGSLKGDPFRGRMETRMAIEGYVQAGKLTFSESSCISALKLFCRWREVVTGLVASGQKFRWSPDSDPTSTTNHLPTSFDIRLRIERLAAQIRDGTGRKLATLEVRGLSGRVERTVNGRMDVDLDIARASGVNGISGDAQSVRQLFLLQCKDKQSEERHGDRLSDLAALRLKYVLDVRAEQGKHRNVRDLTVRIADIDTVLVHETIIALAAFAVNISGHSGQSPSSRDQVSSEVLVDDDGVGVFTKTEGKAAAAVEVGIDTTVCATATMKSLNVSFASSGCSLMRMTLSSLVVDTKIQSIERNMTMAFSLREFLLTDLTAVSPEHSRVIHHRGSQDRVWTLLSNAKEEIWTLSAELDNLQIIYLHRFGTMCSSYLTAISQELRALVGDNDCIVESDNGAVDDDSKSMGMQFPSLCITVCGLDMVLPRHSSITFEAIRLLVSSLVLTTTPTRALSTFVLSAVLAVSEYDVYVLYAPCVEEIEAIMPGDDRPDRPPIIAGQRATILCEAGPRTDVTKRDPRAPGVRVQCSVREVLQATMSEAEYTVLYQVAMENFRENGDPSSQEPRHLETEGSESKGDLNYGNGLLPLEAMQSRESVRSAQRGKPRFEFHLDVMAFHALVIAGADMSADAAQVVLCRVDNIHLHFEWCTDPNSLYCKVSSELDSVEDAKLQRIVLRPMADVSRTQEDARVSREVVLIYDRPRLKGSNITVSAPRVQLMCGLDFLHRVSMLTLPATPFLPTTAPGTLFFFRGRLLLLNFDGVHAFLLLGDGNGMAPMGSLCGLRMQLGVLISCEWARETRDLSIFAQLHKIQIGLRPDEKMLEPLILPFDAVVRIAQPSAGDKSSINLSFDGLHVNLADPQIPELLTLFRQTRLQIAYLRATKLATESSEQRGREEAPLNHEISVELRADGLRILFATDGPHRIVPRLELLVDLLHVKSILPSLFTADLCMSLRAFNEDKGRWMQGIDPWKARTTVSYGFKSKSLGVSLLSDDRLDLTVSPAMIRCVRHVVEAITKAMKLHRSPVKSGVQSNATHAAMTTTLPSKRQSMLLLKNETGRGLLVTLPAADGSMTIRRSVPEHAVEEIDISRTSSIMHSSSFLSHLDGDRAGSVMEHSFVMKLPGFRPLGLSTANVGSRVVTLASTTTTASPHTAQQSTRSKINGASTGPSAAVVWELEQSGGNQVGTLRSLMRVINRSGVDVELLVGSDPLTNASFAVQSEQSLAIPVALVGLPFRVRPVPGAVRGKFQRAAEEYLWSEHLHMSYQDPVQLWVGAPDAQRRHSKSSPEEGGKQLRVAKLICKPLELLATSANVCFVVVSKPAAISTATMASSGRAMFQPQDLELRAPITLENLLPIAVHFCLSERTKTGSEGLMQGKIEPLEVVNLFRDGVDLDKTSVSLHALTGSEIFQESWDLDGGPLSRLKEDTVSRKRDANQLFSPCSQRLNVVAHFFLPTLPLPQGVAVLFTPWRSTLESQSTSSARGSAEGSARGSARRSARASLSGSLNIAAEAIIGGTNARTSIGLNSCPHVRWQRQSTAFAVGHNITLSADFWVRNRSSVDLRIRSVSLGDHHHAVLRARPPKTEPDPYVFFLGSYVSLLPCHEDSDGHVNARGREKDNVGFGRMHSGTSALRGSWTTPIELNAVHGSKLVLLPNVSLTVEVRRAEGRFSGTFVVVIRNAVWLENRYGRTMMWQIDGEEEGGSVGVNERVSLHWKRNPQADSPMLRLGRPGQEWRWSRALRIDMDGEYSANIYNVKEQQQHLVRVISRGLDGGSRLLVVHREVRDHPPYRIRNECARMSLAFWQANAERVAIPSFMRPGREMGYYWDDPDVSRRNRKLRVEIMDQRKELQRPGRYIDLNIDEVGNYGLVGPGVKVSVAVDTATKVVTFVDASIEDLTGMSVFQQRDSTNSLLLRQLSSFGGRARFLRRVDGDGAKAGWEHSVSTHASPASPSSSLEKKEKYPWIRRTGSSAALSPAQGLAKADRDSPSVERLEKKDLVHLQDETAHGSGRLLEKSSTEEPEESELPQLMLPPSTTGLQPPIRSEALSRVRTTDLLLRRSSSFHVRGSGTSTADDPETNLRGNSTDADDEGQQHRELMVSEVCLDVYLRAGGLSIVDDTPEEIAYSHTADIYVNFSSSAVSLRRNFSLELGSLQIDNQLVKPRWPVLLFVAPREHDSEDPVNATGHSMEVSQENSSMMKRPWSLPVVSLSASQTLGGTQGVIMFDRVSVNIRTRIDFSLDHETVAKLSRFSRQLVMDSSCDDRDEPLITDMEEEWTTSTSFDVPKAKMYITELTIAPMTLNLSFSSGGNYGRREEGGLSSAQILERTIATTVGNVENAELVFEQLEHRHLFETVTHIRSMIQRFYMGQLKRQRLRLVASNELLGNPSSLMESIAKGARDFVVEPLRSSDGFFAGIGKGSASLITNTFGGLFSSIGLIPRVLANGLDEAIADDQFATERLAIRGRYGGSRSPVEGVYRGVVSLAHGIANGATGALLDPLQGALRNGAIGFCHGCYRGLIGLALKPATGALDLIAEPAGGFQHMFAYGHSKLPQPLRPPRCFSSYGQSTPLYYDFRLALGAEILNAVNHRAGDPNEVIIHWVELGFDEEDREDLSKLWLAVRRLTRSSRQQVPLSFAAKAARKARVAMITSRRFFISTISGSVLFECEIARLVETRVALGSSSSLLVGIEDDDANVSGGQVAIVWPRVECGSAELCERLRSALQMVIVTLQGTTAPEQSIASAKPQNTYEMQDFTRDAEDSDRRSDLSDCDSSPLGGDLELVCRPCIRAHKHKVVTCEITSDKLLHMRSCAARPRIPN